MFKPLAAIQKEILKTHQLGTQVTLETIETLVCDMTQIDTVVYIGYEAPPDNPIWGGFQRWSKRPSVYAGLETLVEIRYAQHLSPERRRLVVAKELCHALDASVGAHVNTEAAAENLVNSFSLFSNTAETANLSSVRSEVLAEVGAIELLCPVPWRKQMVAGGAIVDYQAVSQTYGMPLDYATNMFREGFMQATEWLLENGS
jgi:hypothetical protein